MIERQDQLLTSALTLSEILVKPLEMGDRELMRHYERAITASAAVLPFDQAASAAFATVRQDPLHPSRRRHPTRLRVGGRRGHVHHQRSAVESACGARHPLHPVASRGQTLTKSLAALEQPIADFFANHHQRPVQHRVRQGAMEDGMGGKQGRVGSPVRTAQPLAGSSWKTDSRGRAPLHRFRRRPRDQFCAWTERAADQLGRRASAHRKTHP